MKRDRIWQAVCAAGLALCLSAGSLGAMATGLELMSGEQLLAVVIWCALSAAAISAVCAFRWAPLGLLILAAALAFRWVHGPLEASAARLALDISTIYDSGYGWGVIRWTEDPASGTLLPAFRALALLLSFPVCWAVNRRGTAWSALPLTVLPLVSTLVLTDTVPHTGYLAVYLFGVILFLFSQPVRRRDIGQGNRMCLSTAAPVALALVLIFLLNPRSSYHKQDLADKLEHAVVQLAESFTLPEALPPEPSGLQLPVTGDTSESINLENVGPKSRQTLVVMQVRASRSGTVYLRGASFAAYDGQTWRVGNQVSTLSQWPQVGQMTPVDTLTITTRSLHSVQYVPYYSSLLHTLSMGKVENREDLKTYEIVCYEPGPTVFREASQAQSVGLQYTQLPEATREWAAGVVGQLMGNTPVPHRPEDVYRAAQIIGNYVRSSATYSLDTPRMPKGEEDFARWFLEESSTGYCVHFASSAAVLLRAAGIPSRYVTGYVASLEAGQTVDVLMANSHAWVEYYLPGIGWMVLEATPSNSQDEIPPEPTLPPEVSMPLNTQPLGTTPGHSEPGISETTPPGAVTTPEGTETRPIAPENPENTTGTPPGAVSQEPEPSQDWRWLKYILWPAAAAAVILGQWWVRVNLRRRWLRSGRGNRRALIYWREAELVAQLLGETPPEALLSLAQKAKFSQHTLTREELTELRAYLAQGEKRLRSHPWYKQLVYRLVYAMY